MWGCFQSHDIYGACSIVFPMHVGVFLILKPISSGSKCLPHACGGVSPEWFYGKLRVKSSPCMWGCFYRHNFSFHLVGVFPMHVGVFPCLLQMLITVHRLPHACGGVSIQLISDSLKSLSSPCMWGCFQRVEPRKQRRAVFPMHVGVFLKNP